MRYVHYILVLLSIIVLSCAADTKEYILDEKDLIPEGTAYNLRTNTIYIGSIFKQKILGITQNGEVEEIINQKHFGKLSPIGMEMDNSQYTLWVCAAAAPIVNQSNAKDWKTSIMAFDLYNQTLKKEYQLKVVDSVNFRVFFNDITVTNEGDVYTTESVNSKIYKIDKTSNKLKFFKNLAPYTFPNGITYHTALHALFVATDQGIVKLDLKNETTSLLSTSDSINTKVIDGLAIYDDYFIGHQSTKVSKFFFNEDISKITKVEVLASGDEFDSSTTGEIGNDYYHYIVNSQIRSGVDRTQNTIKPLDSLENIIIRSIKLK
nr:hypothetical protein [uncultured Psychroserpens sp.]